MLKISRLGTGLILLGLAACQAASSDEVEQVEERAQSVAAVAPGTALFVVGNATLSAPDTALRNRLQGLGYTVTSIAGPASKAADAMGKALVVISESVTSGDVNTKFRSVTVPVLSLENGVFDDLGLTGAAAGDYGEVTGQTQLQLVAVSHPMAEGITLTVTSSAQAFAFGKPAAGAVRIANIAASSAQAAIFGYEAGQAMVGLNAPARRVGWFAGKTTASALTAQGWSLFDAAVRWARGSGNCTAGQKQACGGSVGSCSPGTRTCSTSGEWGSCSGGVQPKATDSCASGNDDNCNGVANEGCACISSTTRACGTSAGSCATGTQTCNTNGSWNACVGGVVPKPSDSCAPGNDDSCNGISNEGCACIGGQTQACGASSSGSRTCSNAGQWGACVGDGGCVAAQVRACGSNVGSCSVGSQLCSTSGQWGACTGGVQPAAADSCAAGNDDNCNGAANEGCTCINGTIQACGSPAVGNCRPGTRTCNNGVFGACVGGVSPAPVDTCAAGNDANCNGITNEGCACLIGATSSCGSGGTMACTSSGQWGPCTGG